MSFDLDELSRRVEKQNAAAAEHARVAEETRGREIVVEARERIMGALSKQRWACAAHGFVAHVNKGDHPDCRRCSYPEDHPVHGS